MTIAVVSITGFVDIVAVGMALPAQAIARFNLLQLKNDVLNMPGLYRVFQLSQPQ